jgi:hypothetical protein
MEPRNRPKTQEVTVVLIKELDENTLEDSLGRSLLDWWIEHLRWNVGAYEPGYPKSELSEPKRIDIERHDADQFLAAGEDKDPKFFARAIELPPGPGPVVGHVNAAAKPDYGVIPATAKGFEALEGSFDSALEGSL